MPRACYRAGRRTFEARRSLPSRMNNRCDCMMIDIRSVSQLFTVPPRAHPIDIIWYYTGTRYGFLTNFLCIQHSERHSCPHLIAQPPIPLPAQLRILAPPSLRSPVPRLPGLTAYQSSARGLRGPYAILMPYLGHMRRNAQTRSDQPRIEPGAGNRGGSMRGLTATLLTSRQSGCSVGQIPLERKNARAAFSRELPVPSLVSATASAQGGIGNDTSGRSTTRIRLSRFVWIISLRRSLRHTERTHEELSVGMNRYVYSMCVRHCRVHCSVHCPRCALQRAHGACK